MDGTHPRERPVDLVGPANDLRIRDMSPMSRVHGVVAVVTECKEAVFRHDDRSDTTFESMSQILNVGFVLNRTVQVEGFAFQNQRVTSDRHAALDP